MYSFCLHRNKFYLGDRAAEGGHLAMALDRHYNFVRYSLRFLKQAR
jgi:hypothetical protein